jgi:hypothetical protein
VAVTAAVAVGRPRGAAVMNSSPVASAAPPSPEPAQGRSRQNPWPIGTAGAVSGWRVKVIGITADADATIADASGSSEPPDVGYQWVMVTVHVVRTSAESGDPAFDMTWSYLGRDGSAFHAQPVSPPGDLWAVGPLRLGASANGNVAFQVLPPEVAEGVLSIEVSSSSGVKKTTRFWSLS